MFALILKMLFYISTFCQRLPMAVEDGLMPRVKEVDGMEGFAGVYANCPDLFKGFMFNYGVLWSHSKLDLVRLKSANLNGCRY